MVFFPYTDICRPEQILFPFVFNTALTTFQWKNANFFPFQTDELLGYCIKDKFKKSRLLESPHGIGRLVAKQFQKITVSTELLFKEIAACFIHWLWHCFSDNQLWNKFWMFPSATNLHWGRLRCLNYLCTSTQYARLLGCQYANKKAVGRSGA